MKQVFVKLNLCQTKSIFEKKNTYLHFFIFQHREVPFKLNVSLWNARYIFFNAGVTNAMMTYEVAALEAMVLS